jgi:hypothetical protein
MRNREVRVRAGRNGEPPAGRSLQDRCSHADVPRSTVSSRIVERGTAWVLAGLDVFLRVDLLLLTVAADTKVVVDHDIGRSKIIPGKLPDGVAQQRHLVA